VNICLVWALCVLTTLLLIGLEEGRVMGSDAAVALLLGPLATLIWVSICGCSFLGKDNVLWRTR
jgi:hypothetical protein